MEQVLLGVLSLVFILVVTWIILKLVLVIVQSPGKKYKTNVHERERDEYEHERERDEHEHERERDERERDEHEQERDELEHERDPITQSNELETTSTLWPSEAKSSRYDKKRWEKQKEDVLARNVSDNSPTNLCHLPIDTTTVFEKGEVSGGDLNKSSQRVVVIVQSPGKKYKINVHEREQDEHEWERDEHEREGDERERDEHEHERERDERERDEHEREGDEHERERDEHEREGDEHERERDELEHERDPITQSNELETTSTLWPSEAKSSRYDKKRWEKQKEDVLARNVSDNSPTNLCHLPIDTTTVFEKGEVSGGDLNKSSQRDNVIDLKLFLRNIGLERYKTSKLTFKDILDIGPETCKKIKPSENVFWCFLQKLVALNATARVLNSIDTEENDDNQEFTVDDLFDNNDSTTNAVNPLDVVCALLHCSHMFLQQEILRKMSLCQFAVPLILPAVDDSNSCTFMLFGLRDIVKSWTPINQKQQKGYAEESIVQHSMPVISFVRLGKNSYSKSKLLNQILSPEEQVYDFFVHLEMNGGDVKRKIADGLVEVAWYFPAGKESDIFHDPITIANLRGDLQNNKKQFCLLSNISQTVFIFIEDTDVQNHCFIDIDVSSKNYFFIISFQSSKIIDGKFKTFLTNLSCVESRKYLFIISKENKDIARKNLDFLKNIFPDLNQNIIVLNLIKSQERQIARKIQLLMKELISTEENTNSLQDMTQVAYAIGIDVDENCKECKDARTLALEITKSISDVVVYKKETMKLQGDAWRELAKLEKELCQMKNQGNQSGEEYKSQLKNRIFSLRKQQYEQRLPDGMKTFLDALNRLPREELPFFFKWLKFDLDAKSRKSILQVQQTRENGPGQNITDRNLEVEHFLRELGQFYEAECFMTERETNEKQRKFHHLPKLGAHLLLDGFPLELIDGNASNVPLQWISNVLKELDKKTGGKCKIRVISVLGVQSTGKSTLLNTMFGLQFPVASGRCTRGAFMTLLNVKENFQEELGCDFILVIDTEGLRAPELATLGDSNEHDNELATLVVGLSDITIVTLAMENTTEMSEILQIVVHAFLRINKIGKIHNCQFVHQNVSDVSAHDRNMRDNQLLLEKLDEMTKIAATMENYDDVTQFSEIIDFEIERDNWYISGLWHGVPPMASISTGYSENVNELKMHLLELIKQKPHSDQYKIGTFIEWIGTLWDAVKHEKFIFSFRSSLVAKAYDQLCTEYSEQEWKFRKEAHSWMIKTENKIKNQIFDQQEPELKVDLNGEINQILSTQAQIMQTFLINYFEKDDNYVKSIQHYKNEFISSVSRLQQELDYYLNTKYREVIRIQNEKNKIASIQANYQKKIEEQVCALVERYKYENRKLSVEELESEFQTMWNRTLQEFILRGLKRQEIAKTMLEHLRKNMKNKASYINQKLVKLDSLEKYKEKDFKMKIKYLEDPVLQVRTQNFQAQFAEEATAVALTILDRCNRYVANKISTKEDYNETFCQQILDIVDNSLQEKQRKRSYLKPLFELRLKLFTLGKAAPMFQKMHEDFIRENDPKLCLEKLKPLYLNTFKEVYANKNDCRERARRFCKLCLKPALIGYVFLNLGHNITEDVLHNTDAVKYSTRTFFQTTVLNDLLTEKIFKDYVKYCLHYEIFVKDWITKHLTVQYTEPERLKRLISSSLKTITNKVRESLDKISVLNCPKLSESLKDFCKILKDELVISQNNMDAVIFPDIDSVQEFFQYVKPILCDIEGEILTELTSFNVEDVLSRVSIKPQDDLFKKVFGCGEQCPFCKVPCEAGGIDHKEHFSSIHRPQGLGQYNYVNSDILCHKLCSTDVATDSTFECQDTDWRPHPYKEYQKIYPDWKIQSDPSIEAALYWKYIFKEFNQDFAKEYNAKPAKLPDDWHKITEEQAFDSIKSK